ncbi:hypothetical protein Barb7_00033 [Bacteroidales bacterium Barb7]|nr:hypothetical protein Barb7_00066 [Bacteroidales bacterium Barb7]OAV76301.1 hypothetical protein Barb7_00015 [Bacteroidales bacterium Barb7]OAV76319.1 hypothetical protein Barb7_00033 [Bacteroidales bacterium Barb7]
MLHKLFSLFYSFSKILVCAIFVFSLASCEKKQELDVLPEAQLKYEEPKDPFMYENPNNPYDYVGYLHNQSLKETLDMPLIQSRQISGREVVRRSLICSNSLFSNNLHFLSEGYQSSSEEITDDRIDESEAISYAIQADMDNDLSNYINTLDLSIDLKTKVKKLYSEIRSDENLSLDDAINIVKKFETEINNNNTISSNEKATAFCAASTLRYSLVFWDENLPEQQVATRGFWKKFWRVVTLGIADSGAALVGGIAGPEAAIILGAATSINVYYKL